MPMLKRRAPNSACLFCRSLHRSNSLGSLEMLQRLFDKQVTGREIVNDGAA